MHPFLLGERPCLADFSLIGPLYAHLYRDPKSGELMRLLAPAVAEWVERTHAGEAGTGDLAANDTIPETLLPILQRQMREQLPALTATNELFAGWAANASSGTPVPRALGQISVSIEGHAGPAAARSFPLWRLQAVLDAYGEMDSDAKARADELLGTIGGTALAGFQLPARLARKDCRLVLA